MSENVLSRIALQVQKRMEERRQRCSRAQLESQVAEMTRVPHDWKQTLKRGAFPSIIAEVKRASPSEGWIAQNANPCSVAQEYLEAGAAALSILTEEDFFGGSLETLEQIRRQFPEARILRKDFVLEEYQVLESRHAGADAILLIMALLGRKRLGGLLKYAEELGLQTLVEVHSEEELRDALALGVSCVGVNHRDLKTLRVSLDLSEKLMTRYAGQAELWVAESGLSRAQELQSLAQKGYDAFLMGTTFMKQSSPGQALRSLLEEARR